MKHTPGPWKMGRAGIILAESRSERKAIGQFTGITSEQQHVDEHAGNCRLIEAAPDLLKTLKLIIGRMEDDGIGHSQADLYNVGLRVIAKAEGRNA